MDGPDQPLSALEEVASIETQDDESTNESEGDWSDFAPPKAWSRSLLPYPGSIAAALARPAAEAELSALRSRNKALEQRLRQMQHHLSVCQHQAAQHEVLLGRFLAEHSHTLYENQRLRSQLAALVASMESQDDDIGFAAVEDFNAENFPRVNLGDEGRPEPTTPPVMSLGGAPQLQTLTPAGAPHAEQ